MSPEDFKRAREKLGLTQAELAELLGLAGRTTVTHYETGFRKPGVLAVALMRILTELPSKKSVELRELLLRHVRSVKKASRRSS